ncbi:uncharacterized protein LOC127797984 isoform X1 [Diospyros lotus]|uniref:uncharacterized protein LOC127797984 isoform X1 n=1 Tax=Diospyros lotus TaxID=55363 RepID=UPI00224EA0FB|nr:uncharacterized protein LOC127797984 isoform X1 [Diospyros lotus]
MMTILFFFAFGVAFRTALTKLEKISQSTGDLRRRQKDLQEQVKEFKELFRELSRQMRRQIAGLEEAIAEAMELSKSKDKQANESSVLLPLAACAVAYGLCFPLLLLSTILQVQTCLLMLIHHSGKDWDFKALP